MNILFGFLLFSPIAMGVLMFGCDDVEINFKELTLFKLIFGILASPILIALYGLQALVYGILKLFIKLDEIVIYKKKN